MWLFIYHGEVYQLRFINDMVLNKNTCQIETVDDLIKFGKKNQFPNGIPRIIHYVYKDHKLPIQYAQYANYCMKINDNIKFVFWTDKSAAKMIFKYFPKHVSIYKTYLKKSVESLKRSDINRYFILSKFGGIYMDLDTKCQKPFHSVMYDYSCFLSTEVPAQSQILWNYDYLAMNSLMACIPGHRFFSFILKKLEKHKKINILEQTGPIWITNVFKLYLTYSNYSKDFLSLIVLANSYTFSPLVDKYLEIRCVKPSGASKIKGCKDLIKYRRIEHEKIRQAVAVHLFMHLGYEDRKYLIKRTLNICLKFKDFHLILSK